MIAIVDYGVGNLFSLKSSLEFIGAEVTITNDEKCILNSDKIILPGVGAFEDAVKKLKASGLNDIVISEAKSGKPLLGICLGMQMLFERSYEYGVHEGLGLLEGDVRPLQSALPAGLKIPHIGWNILNFTENKSQLFRYINNGDFVYFVHSYYADTSPKNVIAYSDYGIPVTAAITRGNIYGCQFHPEKSGIVGLNILRGFCESEDI